MKKLILGFTCALALTGSLVHAQTSTSTSTTSTSADGTTSIRTTAETTGTVTEYTPGASFTLNTGSGDPTMYKFSKSVTYVTPDGNAIEATKVRKDSRVCVHYVKENGAMLVDKVIVLP